jgi:hypothetical protein
MNVKSTRSSESIIFVRRGKSWRAEFHSITFSKFQWNSKAKNPTHKGVHIYIFLCVQEWNRNNEEFLHFPKEHDPKNTKRLKTLLCLRKKRCVNYERSTSFKRDVMKQNNTFTKSKKVYENYAGIDVLLLD